MFERYGVYYTAEGPLARQGAHWLGWDVARGTAPEHPLIEGIDPASLTETPRKYGFHGTLKAPFHLAEGKTPAELEQAVATLASRLAPATADALEVTALGRFLALTPTGDHKAIRALAAKVVKDLDPFRAPLSNADLARRRKSNLTAQQEENLQRWGYPHVMEQFNFHMTLTGRLPRADVDRLKPILQGHFAPVLPTPFALDALTLVGQRPDGMFVTIERFTLG